MTVNATGNAETQVSTLLADSVFEPMITLLPTGGWIAVWTLENEEPGNEFGHTMMQRFDAGGNPVGDEVQVGDPKAFYFSPTVLPLSDGGWLVIHDGGDIFQQRFDANGNTVGSETQINTVSGDLRTASATVLGDGSWVVAWTRGAGNEDVFQQKFDVDGNAVGGEVRVNTTTSGRQFMDDLAALPDGGWVVTFGSPDNSSGGIFQQRYDADGEKVGSQTRVNTTTSGSQQFSTVTVIADGGWVVTWFGPDSDQNGVFQQRYDSNGAKVGTETLVNTTTASFQTNPDVASLADGGWVIVWRSGAQDGDGTGVYQQRYDANGNTVGTETLVNETIAGNQNDPSVTALDGGGWIVTWSSEDPDTGEETVQQRAFAIDVEGTDDAETLAGTAIGEVLRGFGGSDTYIVNSAFDDVVETGNQGRDTVRASVDYTLADNVETLVLTGRGNLKGTGNALANTITGNSGNNTLAGGSGNDVLNGGVGADRMIGGAGNEAYIVDNRGDRVVERAREGTDLVKSSVSFTLSSEVENLVLTGRHAITGAGNGLANAVTGNAGANTLRGGGGNDVLKGLGGNDLLDGGRGGDRMFGGVGNDTYVVASRSDRVIESGGQGRDLVKAFIDFTLGKHVEKLTLAGRGNLDGTGNSLANTITGNGGNNTLSGGGGNDTLDGGAGKDTLKGGGGRDRLVGDKGADKLLGGGGADQFVFLSAQDSTVKGRGRDFIDDFSRAQDDRINLKAIDADTTHRGNQKFEFIGTDKFDKDAGELRFQKQGGNTLVSADRNGDGKADFAILFDGNISFRGDDFIL